MRSSGGDGNSEGQLRWSSLKIKLEMRLRCRPKENTLKTFSVTVEVGVGETDDPLW